MIILYQQKAQDIEFLSSKNEGSGGTYEKPHETGQRTKKVPILEEIDDDERLPF
jgi:hypothetical protein